MRPINLRGLAVLTALALPIALLTIAGTSGAAEPDGGSLTATALSPADRVEGSKAASSALAKSSPGLLKRTDSTLVPVMIKLDQDALASYRGGVSGLAATSPSVTGHKLNPGSKAARAYDAYLARNEQQFAATLAEVAPRATVRSSFRIVYGGVSALVPANRVQDILRIDGVVAIQADRMAQPLTDSSAAFLNAAPVYTKLGGTSDAGQGLIYGNLDTGVWPEHPSFADQGNLSAPPGPARQCNFGDNPLTPANDPFVCNNKLIGGQPFLASYLADPSRAGAEPFHTARDSNGHGTHTSSTSAGNVVANAPVLGIQRGPIAGMAPGAWVMEYKVCGIQGCFGSDSAAAVQQAILDGVKVINFSISGGTDPMTDPVELAFLDAYAAGVFVSTSAGNDGPGPGTVNHLSPWVTTVAASTQTREFATTLNVTADNADTLTLDGASITPGAGPAPIVLSSEAPYSDPLCSSPAPPGTFTGKIVACQRSPGRVLKGFNVLQGGAVGMVLYNPSLADAVTDTHWLPTVHLADGTGFVAFMNAHTGEVASFAAGEKRNAEGDVMANFSSRGPGGNFIKPDVTAPGVQILAGDTPIVEGSSSGPGGEYFQAIAGTSMSSPHVAGAAVLVRATHPTWSPGQVKSALMTTSIEQVVKQDLTTPADPFDMGAGRIDIGKADLAPLSFDETAVDYAAMAGDPLNAVHLNVPSINAPVLPGRLTTTRTARNVTGVRSTFVASTTAPAGSAITVSPKIFTLAAGAEQTLQITIRTSAPIDAQQFGEIRLKRTKPASVSHLPVAWIHTQGDVSLTQACSPETIPVGAQSTCTVTATNDSFDDRTVDLDTTTSSNLSVVGATGGATVVDAHHAQLHDVSVSGRQAGVPSVDPGELFGYLPLDEFGIAPVPVGDEDIINFNVPAYVYNGVTYSRLAVDSNGYLVAGGGTVEDNNCCSLPGGPSPARPNNVLAPFWTDLDGTGAPGVFVGVLTDGVDSWIVAEHRVNVFGTTSSRVFQVWIGINGTQDITYAYDPANLPADPNGQTFLVGAENELGEGDMTADLPTTDQRVTSTTPSPGGSVSYDVIVLGTMKGTGLVTTEMDADGVPGVTIEEDTITVTK